MIRKTDKKIERARKAIERENSLCYEVALEHGQIFGNVKHMRWFIEAVAAKY